MAMALMLSLVANSPAKNQWVVKMVRLSNQTKDFLTNIKINLRTKWTWKVAKRNRPSMVWYKNWGVQDVAHSAVQQRTVWKTSIATVQCINQIRTHHDRTDEWTIMHNQVKWNY